MLISFKAMIEEMKKVDRDNQPKPFSLKAVTHDKIRGTGGQVLFIKNGILSRQTEKSADKRKPSKGSPRHFENSTLNIRVLPSNEIRKIHPRLIIEFNGKKIIH